MAAPYNPRQEMDGHQFAALRRGLTELGVLDPVILNLRTVANGWPEDARPVIVGGHQRIRAAQAEGIEEFPVFWVDLDEWQEQEANIALNAIHGRWDDEALAAMLRRIRDAGRDLAITGIDDAELKRRLQVISEGRRAADDQPTRVQRRVGRGDVWQLGRHLLACGDSTDPSTQANLWEIAGTKPRLCVTDPPYGVEYDPEWREKHLGTTVARGRKVTNDDRADWQDVWDAMPCDVIYHWCAGGDLMLVAGAGIQRAGFEIRASIIWAKTNFPISRGHYTFTHEPCFYAVRKGGKAYWIGDKSQQSVWRESLDENVPGGHSTQKPVALFTHAIGNHDGDVFEPFAGSGTCVIACEQLSRRCFAIEIDEHYCDVVVARWEAFTGEKAVRLQGAGAKTKKRRRKG